MCINLAAWARIASTTFGWQCPAATTAMPALQSRKRFPSTSSTIAPSPRAATSGYERVYDGDITRLSRSIIALALGPGTDVIRCGRSALTDSMVFMTQLLEFKKALADQQAAEMEGSVGSEQGGPGCRRCCHAYVNNTTNRLNLIRNRVRPIVDSDRLRLYVRATTKVLY